MPIRAARREPDSPIPQAAGLALHARQDLSVIDHEVIACVLAERQKHRESGTLQGEHHRER
jgi:thymidine phosphorylase